MDTNIALSVVAGVGSISYAFYLARKAVRDAQAHEQAVGQRFTPLLLPEQAVSVHQPKPNIAVRFAEAWREVNEEKKIKALPPLEKVRSIAPEEEKKEEETLESPAQIISIDQLEAHNKVAYYNLICSIIEKVDSYYEKHGKVIRDGLVPAMMSRRDWNHTCQKDSGVFWLSGFLSEDALGVTVVDEKGGENLHEWFKARGYAIADPEGYEAQQ